MASNTGAFLESVFYPERVKRALPAVTLGVGGTAAYGGYIITAEKDNTLIGRQKWVTFDEILLNTSIIAAGVRFFLNLVAKASWKVEPNPRSKNKARAKEYAELVEEIIHDMTNPWVRVVRSAAMYRLHGFHIAEWTSKRREDGVTGFLDIETRPQFTVERWDLDKTGTVYGVVQRSPQDSKEVYLPRAKIIYVVDNSLSDNPEGYGLLRHCVEPARRLQKYYEIEGTGFETDLTGIPVVRAPLEALQKLVDSGTLNKEQRDALILPLQNFIKAHFRGPRSGLLLDSSTYKTQDGSESPSSTYQWDADVVKGGTGPHQFIGTAIDRTLREIARILNVEGLLLGQGQGSYALSKDKTNNFALTVDGTLVDLKNTFDKDVIGPLAQMNGWAKEDTPFFQTDQIAMRDVETITSTLTKMAQAGAVLAPDDPAINDIRSLVGLPALDLEKMAVDATLNKPTEVNDKEEEELESEDEGEEAEGEPVEDEEEEEEEVIEKAQRRVPAGNSSGGQFAGSNGNNGVDAFIEALPNTEDPADGTIGKKPPFPHGFPMNDPGTVEDKPEGKPTSRHQVALKDLISTQYTVDATKVKSIASRGKVSGKSITIIRTPDGKMFIYDGHHRATAARALGQQRIMANVYDIQSTSGDQ